MTIDAEALRRLHGLHRQATDLRNRLANGPKQIKKKQLQVEHLSKEVDAAKELLQKTRMASDEKQLQLKERENRILDVRGKLNSASSNREYQSFMEQIAADEQANSVLSDEILELLEKTDTDKETVTTAEKTLAEGKQQLADLEQRVQSAKEGLEADLATVEQELLEAEKMLPADVKAHYDRVVNAHGEEALAVVEDETCGGCFQRITAQMYSELMMSKLVFCKSCGRLLYLPEDTKVS